MNEPSQLPAVADNSSQLQAPGSELTVQMVMPQHVAAVVPFKDHADYERLCLDQKKRISLLLSLFADIESSPDGIVAASDRLGVINGTSGSNLRNLRSKFKAHGWRALAKIYRGPDKLPAEFVQECRRRIEANGRDTGTAAAWQQLKDDWANGASIPGFGTWREYFRTTRPLEDVPERWPFGFYPEGWSRSTFYSKQSTKAERKLVRQGYAAMKRYIPSVVRDTSGLRPLELITIDDFELDFLVRAFNPVCRRWEICRCAGLLAMDVATRRVLAVALVPRFKLTKRERAQAAAHIAANADLAEGEGETAEERRTRISITRHDVQSLLHAVFSTHGRPVGYGVTILCENASAAITTDFEIALELLLQVQVARTGLITDKTLRNGFAQGGGKPWEKGWIEALFRTLWNHLGTQPGQKGSGYENKPADHEAKVAYAMGLFQLDGLPADLAAQLRVPFITVDEALDGLHAIFARIERRDDHRMIGFDERCLYRLPGAAGLVREEALVGQPQDVLVQCEVLPRRESPVERWEKLMAQVQRVKIADYILACLLLTPKKITLKNHRITFAHAGQGFTYADADSEVMRLDEGTELLGYFDHGRPGVLFVTDLKGAYLGSVRRRGAVDIRDHAAISAEAGEITRLIRSCIITPVRERHEGTNLQILADQQHNEQLLRSANLLPDATPSQAPDANAPTIAAPAATTTKASATERPATLSKRLAQPPARDAFAAYRDTLAHGIAAHVGQQDAAADRAATVRAQGEALSPEDLQAFGSAPAAALQPAPASPGDETLKDYT